MSGGVFLEVLSICYNRTGTFLVAGIYLIKYDRGFVILLVNLLVRFACISLFCSLFFIPCGWSCSTRWMWISSLVCWRCFPLLLFTVLWPLRGRLGNSPVYCLCGYRFLVSLLLLICAALLEGNVSLLFRISLCSIRWVCRLSGSRFWFLCKCKNFQGCRAFFLFSHSELCSVFRPLGRRSALRW